MRESIHQKLALAGKEMREGLGAVWVAILVMFYAARERVVRELKILGLVVRTFVLILVEGAVGAVTYVYTTGRRIGAYVGYEVRMTYLTVKYALAPTRYIMGVRVWDVPFGKKRFIDGTGRLGGICIPPIGIFINRSVIEGYKRNTATTLFKYQSIVTHERAHWLQYARLGFLRFYLIALHDMLIYGSHGWSIVIAPIERDAIAHEPEIRRGMGWRA